MYSLGQNNRLVYLCEIDNNTPADPKFLPLDRLIHRHGYEELI